MNIVKDYMGEIASFIKNEQKMDLLDYIVYIGILLLTTYYLKQTRGQICIINFNIYIALDLIKIVLILLVSSTLIFNLYKLIRDRI